MPILIGIDIGTTNWKVAAFTPEGSLAALHKTPASTRAYGKGQDFYDPGKLWYAAAKMIREVVADCQGEQIAGVSVSSMAESVVPIDAAGEPCFPIIPWFDTRAIVEARQVERRIGRQRLFEITGLDPNPVFSLLKIEWIKNNHPEVYQRATRWLQMADYIYMQLCGAQVTDYTLACRTLAYDLRQKDWSTEILNAMEVPATVLPEIIRSGTCIGEVSKAASRVTGLPAGTPVVVGGNDHPCATIPAGVLKGNKILDSSGTAESFLYLREKDDHLLESYQGQRVCSYLDPAYYAIWGGIIASGASVDWALARLGWQGQEQPVGERAARVERVPVGANGILFLPHLRGSGAPYWDPKGKGAFLGLASSHSVDDMLRAVFEGLSYQARMVVEMQETVAGVQARRLCAVGGGTRIAAWQQIKADITGKTIEIPGVEEASACGAALLAGVGAGIFPNILEAAQNMQLRRRLIKPNPERHERYNQLYPIYQDANRALNKINARLDDVYRQEWFG